MVAAGGILSRYDSPILVFIESLFMPRPERSAGASSYWIVRLSVCLSIIPSHLQSAIILTSLPPGAFVFHKHIMKCLVVLMNFQWRLNFTFRFEWEKYISSFGSERRNSSTMNHVFASLSPIIDIHVACLGQLALILVHIFCLVL